MVVRVKTNIWLQILNLWIALTLMEIPTFWASKCCPQEATVVIQILKAASKALAFSVMFF